MTVAIAIGISLVAPLMNTAAPAGFAPRMFTHGGRLMPYRLFVPDAKARQQPLPLVVYLHGASGMGTNNTSQISDGGNDKGSRLWIRPELQAKYPAFVVAPQLPPGQTWGQPATEKPTIYGQLVLDLIEALTQEFGLDRARVYLIGQSMGGIGTWDLITKRPDVFAAAVPLCGIGNVSRIAAAVDVKVWVFHGAKDAGISPKNSRDLVAALKAAGGTVKYTEYPDVAHDVWTRAFAEPELPAWLFAQRRPPADDCDGRRCPSPR